MHIIEQSVQLIKHDKQKPYNVIEQCARICYKSEDYATDGSDIKMVRALIKNKHLAVLEHEYVYFLLDEYNMRRLKTEVDPQKLKYINFSERYISGSFRAFLELTENEYHPVVQWLLILLQGKYPDIYGDEDFEFEYIDGIKLVEIDDVLNCDSEQLMNLIPHTLKFVTNRGVSHELVRHRVASFCQESQRYVDYNKDKTDHQITVIKPLLPGVEDLNYQNWHYAMLMAETQYINLRIGNIPPEIARGVLPNDCKTEIAITATEQEWQHIINLRYHGTTGKPHPQMYDLMSMAYPILQEESNGRIK